VQAVEVEWDEAKSTRASSLRERPTVSQAAFARRLDVSAETLRNWEQGKRLRQGPARALLRIIDKAPDTAMAALAG
jgi:putative transcriptional regulator